VYIIEDMYIIIRTWCINRKCYAFYEL